jgi:RNA polymerase sigma-70 factor (ECF subfamily)
MAVSSLPQSAFADNVLLGGAGRPEPDVAESFETYRAYLFSIAYRMLGSAMDAEDMVQETYLRYQSASPGSLRSLKAYLTTILTRLCIDQLQLAYRQRETYIGPWLPEPILTGQPGANLEEEVEMRESLSLAFLALLERLQPAERAVFLLRSVFDYEYADIAEFVGKSEAACRQLFARAKRHLADGPARNPAAYAEHRQQLAGFLQAVQNGDREALFNLLAEGATLWADGGGKVPGAATHPVTGRRELSQFAVGAQRRFLPPDYQVELSEVNYQPALIVRGGGRALAVLTIEADEQGVHAVRLIANPDKLKHV